MMDLTIARDLCTVAFGEIISAADFDAATDNTTHPMAPAMETLREHRQFMWIDPRNDTWERKLVPAGTHWPDGGLEPVPGLPINPPALHV